MGERFDSSIGDHVDRVKVQPRQRKHPLLWRCGVTPTAIHIATSSCGEDLQAGAKGGLCAQQAPGARLARTSAGMYLPYPGQGATRRLYASLRPKGPLTRRVWQGMRNQPHSSVTSYLRRVDYLVTTGARGQPLAEIDHLICCIVVATLNGKKVTYNRALACLIYLLDESEKVSPRAEL